jgi:hypothetical protein
VRRAQFRLKQNIERIDWEEDFLTPEIEALKSGKSVLGLPEGMAFDIIIEDQNPPAVADTNADGDDSNPTDGS